MKKCDECDGVYYCKGKCIKHYFKARRKTTRQLVGDAKCECGKPVRARGKCAYHYNVMMGYTNGKVGIGGRQGRKKKEIVGYRAAHIRVEAVKGKAKTHRCVDCGGTAREWSLDPNAVHTYEDGDKVWSLNVEDYSARCVPCHRDLDGNSLWHEFTD